MSIKNVTETNAGTLFFKICAEAGTPPTRRQYKKFQAKRGKAYKYAASKPKEYWTNK